MDNPLRNLGSKDRRRVARLAVSGKQLPQSEDERLAEEYARFVKHGLHRPWIKWLMGVWAALAVLALAVAVARGDAGGIIGNAVRLLLGAGALLVGRAWMGRLQRTAQLNEWSLDTR